MNKSHYQKLDSFCHNCWAFAFHPNYLDLFFVVVLANKPWAIWKQFVTCNCSNGWARGSWIFFLCSRGLFWLLSGFVQDFYFKNGTTFKWICSARCFWITNDWSTLCEYVTKSEWWNSKDNMLHVCLQMRDWCAPQGWKSSLYRGKPGSSCKQGSIVCKGKCWNYAS